MLRFFVVACVLVGGCAKDDLGGAGFVSGLRILGAQANPPEVLVGQSTTITAWIVDTRGGDIDVSWSYCTLPSDGLADQDCVLGGKALVPLGNGMTLTMTAPALTDEQFGPRDGTGGRYVPIVMHATSHGDVADGIYRLRIGPEAAMGMPNTNPMLLDIRNLSDVPPYEIVHPNEAFTTIADYVFGTREAYHVSDDSPEVHEVLTTQWFATAGEFPDTPIGGAGVQTLTFDKDVPALGSTVDLWVVGHDDRGGTDMLHRQLIYQ
jgi:hypothetical protein